MHHVEPVVLDIDKYGVKVNKESKDDDDDDFSQYRVAFAFNIKGDWDDLTDISVSFTKTHQFK